MHTQVSQEWQPHRLKALSKSEAEGAHTHTEILIANGVKHQHCVTEVKLLNTQDERHVILTIAPDLSVSNESVRPQQEPKQNVDVDELQQQISHLQDENQKLRKQLEEATKNKS